MAAVAEMIVDNIALLLAGVTTGVGVEALKDRIVQAFRGVVPATREAMLVQIQSEPDLERNLACILNIRVERHEQTSGTVNITGPIYGQVNTGPVGHDIVGGSISVPGQPNI